MAQNNSIRESTAFEVELVYTFQYISKYFFPAFEGELSCVLTVF